MKRFVILATALLILLIGVTGYQVSAASERSSSSSLTERGDARGVSGFPGGTWNAGIQVQNPTDSTATVQVKFYDQNGTLVHTTASEAIPAGGSKTYYLPSITALPDGKYSAVVESDQAVVAVVNETSYSGLGIADSYNGISSGATQLNLPLIFRGYSNWNSMIALQNTDATATATVSLKFYKTGEATPTYTKVDNIPPLATKTYDVSSTDFSSLGSPFLGSLVITGTTNVAAVAHSAKQTGGYDVLSLYPAFTSGSTSYRAPLVFNQYNPSDATGWTTGIQVQNLGTTADTVTMVYTLDPRSGQTGTYTETLSIGANSSGTFYLPSYSDIPAGTYGSALIQGSNQLAVIVNTTKYLFGVANGYKAFPAGSGSTKVVAPLVFNQYSPNNSMGWVTGIQVQNLGASNATVTMTFTPTNGTGSYTKSKDVAAGASTTFYLPDYSDIPAGLYGSAVITGTQNIIAVVNTTKYASNVATTYVGFNQ
jgi:hypothetical protein